MNTPKHDWQQPRFIDPNQFDTPAGTHDFEPARELSPDEVTAAPETDPEAAAPPAPEPARIWRVFTVTATTLLLGTVGVELYRLLDWSFSQHVLAGTLASTLVTLLLGSGLWQLHQGLKGRRQLNRIASLRHQAEQLSTSREHRLAGRFVHQLERHYTEGPALDSLRQGIAQLDSAYNDAEVIQFLSSNGLQQQDEHARRCVQRYSVESGILVALSPWTSFDMLLVGWRNLRMLKEITRIYGIAPGAATQWKLLRSVVHGIAFAGLSEVAIDAGSAWLGTTLTSAISARTGQGVGAGLFTVRTGLAAIELCRPLPPTAASKALPQKIATAIVARLSGKQPS